MASLDEQRKRAELARLAQLGLESSFQQEMMTDPFLAQAVGPSENRRAFDNRMQNVRDYQSQGLAAAQEASNLLQQEIPQDPIRDNFLTRRGDNQALNLLRGILSQRLISRGLLEDPTDIATRNLRAVQQRNAQIEGLQNQSDFYTNMADRLRADAVDRALAQGVPGVNPVEGLPTPERLSGLVDAAGTFDSPTERANLIRTGQEIQERQVNFGSAEDLDARVRQLFSEKKIDREAANSVLTAPIDKKSERFAALRIPHQFSDSIIGSVSLVDASDVRLPSGRTFEDVQEDRTFGFIRTPKQRDQDVKARENVEEFITEIEPKLAQNAQIYKEIIPKVFNAVIKDDTLFSGPLNVFLSDDAKTILNPEGANVAELSATIAQQSLRELLGGQFAVQENIQLINRFYNRNLPPIFNLARLRRSQKVGEAILAAGYQLKDRMDNNRTLFSADGKNDFKYPTLRDVFKEQGFGSDGLDDLLSELTDEELLALRGKTLSGTYNNESVMDLLAEEVQRRVQ